MIACIRTPTQMADFADVVKIWDQNFVDFGHRGVTLRILDDSPEPFAAQLERFAKRFRGKSGMKVELLGQGKKAALRKAMLTRMVSSDTGKQMIADGITTKDELAQAVQTIFGSKDSRGPGVNRNLSMTLFQSQPGLQMDCDITPEVLTPSFKDAALGAYVADYEELNEAFGIDERRHRAQPTTVPVDLLGYFENAGGFALTTPQISGANDGDIPTMIRTRPEPTEASATADVPVSLMRRDDLNTRQVKILSSGGDPPNRETRGPVFVPSKFGPNDEYVPFSIPLRDEDLHLGMTMEAAGVRREGTPVPMFHREQAGAKWGAKALLLWDTTMATGTWSAFQSLTACKGPLDLDVAAKALIDGAEDPLVGKALRSAINDKWHLASAAHKDQVELEHELSFLRLRISNPSSPEDQLEAVARWRYGDDMDTSEAVKKDDGTYAYQPKISTADAVAKIEASLAKAPTREEGIEAIVAQIDGAIAQCRQCARQFTDLFEVSYHRKKDESYTNYDAKKATEAARDERLVAKMAPIAKSNLRAFGLALMLRKEILGAT